MIQRLWEVVRVSVSYLYSPHHSPPPPPTFYQPTDRIPWIGGFLLLFLRTLAVSRSKMAATMQQMSLIVAFLGIVSFVLAVIAENKKPASGTPGSIGGVVTCNYPSDPTIALGYLSVVFLIAATVVGYFSLFYPYKERSVPQAALFKNTTFFAFFNVALFTSGFALAMLLWPTISEQLLHSRNVHKSLDYACPTAKTGVFGGAAFLSLDSTLFWLVALMLSNNAREDFFSDIDEVSRGDIEARDGVEVAIDGRMKPVS
ncbi:hypothetical protein MLD38_009882 [Melastoma candidum]|uniref:Uncharacterized protein n=1 Tax=Melastoma candidum TaxID=119954 RepID=A0ACB9RYW5_9MYRT|nr:hypothetical protein MLD38_009882 [Melastoma candidum]